MNRSEMGTAASGSQMWWRRAIILLSLLAIVGLLCTARDVAARPLVTGIDAVEGEQVAFQQVESAGASMAVGFVRWSEIAPRMEPAQWQPRDPADPHYDWSSIDSWVEDAVAAGLTPVLQIDGVPRWAQGCQQRELADSVPCEPDAGKFADFTAAAAARYSGQFEGLPRVRYWQALNEPNLSLFFDPQYKDGQPASAGLYRNLLNAFYFAVKGVNPSDVVLAAGLGPVGIPGYTIAPLQFARELLCMKGRRDPMPTRGNCHGGVHFDAFDVHPYTTGGPTHKGHPDDLELGDLPELQELVAAADKAGRIKSRFRHTPLWITEFSWDSKPPDPGGLPMRILQRWTAEAIYRAWNAGFSHFFWLELRDNLPEPKLAFSETIQAGLYFRGPTVAEDRPKPNLQAFRFPFVAYTSKTGFTYWGRTGTSTGGGVRIQVLEHGRWRNAAVAHAAADGIFDGEVATRYGRGRHGMVRALYRKEEAVPFSLHSVRDFHQAPFGNPVPEEGEPLGSGG